MTASFTSWVMGEVAFGTGRMMPVTRA